MSELSTAQEELLKPFPPHYREVAVSALKSGKAFCPSCYWAGMSNCGYFDECGAFLEPLPSARRTEMGEMIERVARAIYENSPFILSEGVCRDVARAAIEAMREPPHRYIEQNPPFGIRGGEGWYPPNSVRAAIWQDMIDSALSKPSQPIEDK